MATKKRYKTTRVIYYDCRRFKLEEGQVFTIDDLEMPEMAAALAKWLRVGAAVEVKDEEAEA